MDRETLVPERTDQHHLKQTGWRDQLLDAVHFYRLAENYRHNTSRATSKAFDRLTTQIEETYLLSGSDWARIRDEVVSEIEDRIRAAQTKDECRESLPRWLEEEYRRRYATLDEALGAKVSAIVSQAGQELGAELEHVEDAIRVEAVRLLPQAAVPSMGGGAEDLFVGGAMVGAAASGVALWAGSALMGNLGLYQLATTVLSCFGSFSFATYSGLTTGIATIGGPVVAGFLASLAGGLVVGLGLSIIFGVLGALFWRDGLVKEVRSAFEKPEVRAQLRERHWSFLDAHRESALRLARNLEVRVRMQLDNDLRSRKAAFARVQPSWLLRLVGQI